MKTAAARRLHPVAFAILATLFAFGSGRADERPNIVFIIADDLGWADVSFHGGTMPTPHLDRLRADGAELTRHYVAPVCTPTRAALMTGRFWSRFGVTSPQNERALPADTVTLPRALQAVGYDTCLTGKWHLGSRPEWGPNHYGFDHSYGSLAGGVGPYDHFYKKGPYSTTWHRNGTLITETGHVTDLIADEAVRWIEERPAAGTPYFLYVPFTAVHLPVKEPQAYLDRVPPTIVGDVPRHYAACIAHLDEAVGRIVDAVDRKGHRERTLIVFTSDNGGSTAENNDTKYPADDYPQGALTGSNRPLRGKKGDLYEGGIRVPTLARWPGRIRPGSTIGYPAHISDWMPTFCSLAGYQPDRDLNWDGIDLTIDLTGGPACHSLRLIYSVAPGFRSRALIAGDSKLIVHGPVPGLDPKADPNAPLRAELYDLAADPGETNDLATQNRPHLDEMLERLRTAARADRDAVAPREKQP